MAMIAEPARRDCQPGVQALAGRLPHGCRKPFGEWQSRQRAAGSVILIHVGTGRLTAETVRNGIPSMLERSRTPSAADADPWIRARNFFAQLFR